MIDYFIMRIAVSYEEHAWPIMVTGAEAWLDINHAYLPLVDLDDLCLFLLSEICPVQLLT